MNYLWHIGITTCYSILLVVSLNVAMGYTGLLNLGHVAFFGVGAYTSAILTKVYHWPFLVALLAAGIVAAVFGYLLILITHRLKGDYLALATLGFSFVMYSVFLNWHSLTRGPLGIVGIQKPMLFGFVVRSNLAYFLCSVVLTVFILVVLHRLLSSRYGRLLEGVRDDAIGLAALGKNVFRLKTQAMTISAGLAGVAGSMFAHYITYIHPSNFFLSDIILLVSMLIIGGLATIRGSVMSVILLVVLSELIRLLPLPDTIIGPARLMLYCIVLLFILLFRPRGLLGKVDLI